MKRITLALLATAFLSLPLAAPAQNAAREGAKQVLEFTVTVKTTGRFVDGRNTQTTSAVNRVLQGRCLLQAGPVGPYGLDGPSKAQEKALNRKDPGMASLEKEAAKCKGNQACLMALAQKASESGFEPASPKVEGAVQVWFPQSCSGSFTANDAYTANIQDGGNLSYATQSTIKGTASIAEGGEKGWLGVYVEHDLAGGQVLYRVNQAPPVMLDQHTVRTGYKAGTTQAKVPVQLSRGAFPDKWGPVKGAFQAGSLEKAVDGGTISLAWRLAR